MPTMLPGHDYSRLGERGIRGAFYDALEADADGGWARSIGFYFKSDAAAETHRWLGQVAALREWVGARVQKGMRTESFTLTNVFYEGTLPVPSIDLRRDKTGQLRVKAAQGLGARANQHWDELAAALLVANPVCYDGQNLYDTDHASGSSGAQANALTVAHIPALNVVDTGDVTVDEAMQIIMRVCPYFWTYLDDQGQPANQGAREFVFVVPTNLYTPFQLAISRLMLATGGDNVLKLARFKASVVLEPRLTTQTVGYCFRVDADRSAALILQEEIEPTFKHLGAGSEYEALNKQELFMCEASRAAGAGQWRHTIRFTIS